MDWESVCSRLPGAPLTLLKTHTSMFLQPVLFFMFMEQQPARPCADCCLTERVCLFIFSPLTINGSVWPPLSRTSALPSRCPSSPCSRDGSSQSEQFPISFVCAGSSASAAARGGCTPRSSLLLRPRPGEPPAVQQPAAGANSARSFSSTSGFLLTFSSQSLRSSVCFASTSTREPTFHV